MLCVTGLMRTACLVPANKAKEVATLLETDQQWPEFSGDALVLWRGPARVETDETEQTGDNSAGLQDQDGEWLPRLLPRKYSPRCPRMFVRMCMYSAV